MFGIDDLAFAIAAPAVVSGIASIFGSKEQSKAASTAANAQTQSNQAALDLQKYMFDLSRKDWGPYREAGYKALPEQRRFADLFSGTVLNPSSFKESPAYQWNLNQGINAIERSATSRGKLDSTQNLKDLMTFGQGLAANEFQQYLQNLLGSANLYGGIAGTGQTATGATTQAGTNYANTASNLYLNQGNIAKDLAFNQANARTGLYSNLAGIGSNAVNDYLMYQILNKMDKPGV